MADQLRELTVSMESYEGRVLAEHVADNPICALCVDPTVPCLVLTWRKNPTSAQTRCLLDQMIEIFASEGLSNLLGDDGPLVAVSEADLRWITDDWMPRAMKAGLRAVASVVPYSYFGQLALEPIQDRSPMGIVRRTFYSVSDAKRWLAEQSTQRGGL